MLSITVAILHWPPGLLRIIRHPSTRQIAWDSFGQAKGAGAPHCAHKEVLILVVLVNTPTFSGESGPADWVGRTCNILS